MSYFPAELIKKKRAGRTHDRRELEFLVNGFVAGDIPDYQMAAWLMAVYFNGMTGPETVDLTSVMLRSGRVLDFSSLGRPAVDKHSTGGVGDKTSLILAPLVAAAGVPVPMIAGRGLGHTGGTLDKLEAIPGFRIGLSLDEFKKQVDSFGAAIIGQTAEICPADKRIYALRDVTATVESQPLICASIMSKKLAEGIDGLVLDVKHGSGAFMKTVEQADELATKLMGIGASHGKKVAALLTRMDEPLGRFIGNAVEVGECVAILKNEPYLGRAPSEFADTTELTLELAGAMIWLGGGAPTLEAGRATASGLLTSGEAWEAFAALCRRQGGDLDRLPVPTARVEVKARASGYVAAFDAEKIGLAAIALGGGRLKTTDTIDPVAGIETHRKLGDGIREGETLFTLLGSSSSGFAQAEAMLSSATTISLQKPVVPSLITRRKVP